MSARYIITSSPNPQPVGDQWGWLDDIDTQIAEGRELARFDAAIGLPSLARAAAATVTEGGV